MVDGERRFTNQSPNLCGCHGVRCPRLGSVHALHQYCGPHRGCRGRGCMPSISQGGCVIRAVVGWNGRWFRCVSRGVQCNGLWRSNQDGICSRRNHVFRCSDRSELGTHALVADSQYTRVHPCHGVVDLDGGSRIQNQKFHGFDAASGSASQPCGGCIARHRVAERMGALCCLRLDGTYERGPVAGHPRDSLLCAGPWGHRPARHLCAYPHSLVGERHRAGPRRWSVAESIQQLGFGSIS